MVGPDHAFWAGYWGLPFGVSPAYVAGYQAGLNYRADRKGEGVACGRSWISRRKKCSKAKSAITPEENLRLTSEKQRARQALRRQVELAKGQKPYVKPRPDPSPPVGPTEPPHKNPRTPQEFIENGRAISGAFLDRVKALKPQIDENLDDQAAARERLMFALREPRVRQDAQVAADARAGSDPDIQKAKADIARARRMNAEALQAYTQKEMTYPEYALRNKDAAKSEKAAVDRYNARFREIYNEEREKHPTVRWARKNLARAVSEGDQIAAPAKALRDQLLARSRVSRADAEKIASRIKKPGGYKTKDPELPEKIADFMQLTNGKASRSLNRITSTQQRAHATRDGLARYHGKDSHDVLFHEMGHHAEFENPDMASAAMEWVRGKSRGELQTLRSLTGNRGYSASEKAYPGDFVSPYVGKVYPDSSITEVISMGLEHFSSPMGMVKLASADPDHFALVLGMMQKQ